VRSVRTSLPWGFDGPSTLSRHAGLTSPDFAAPSGFLNLLALCSARIPSGLVSCRSRPWASSIFRGFPSKGARPASRVATRCLPKATPVVPLFTVWPCPPCRYSICFAPRLMRSALLDFEDFSPLGVRSPRTGFTRDPWVDSSLDLHSPSRSIPRTASANVSPHQPPLLGFATMLGSCPPSP
jgi:hypothetical protein